MEKQRIMQATEYVEEIREVTLTEVLRRAPKRVTKKYEDRVRTQRMFIDHAISTRINREINSQMAKVGNGEKINLTMREIELTYPLIFPMNEEVLPETMMYIAERGLKLFEKLVNGERVLYSLEGVLNSFEA